MVERNLAKVEVAGPNPVFRSTKLRISPEFFLFVRLCIWATSTLFQEKSTRFFALFQIPVASKPLSTSGRGLIQAVPDYGHQAVNCYLFSATYLSAFSFILAARFSLSGCEENIFCTAEAFSPLESSTSLLRLFAMP